MSGSRRSSRSPLRGRPQPALESNVPQPPSASFAAAATLVACALALVHAGAGRASHPLVPALVEGNELDSSTGLKRLDAADVQAVRIIIKWPDIRSEEHTTELQPRPKLVCPP